MGNRRASPRSSQGARKGTSRRGRAPRRRSGWSGPTKPGQSRASNSTAAPERPRSPKGGGGGARAQGSRKAPERDPPRDGGMPKGERSAPPGQGRQRAEAEQERPRSPRRATEGDVELGPEKVEELKGADGMVVGTRTVVHHAAKYGIVRGMTWTVILSALLFWLPLLGPALAGYVGGRKAGGPLRALVAIAIPAVVLLVAVAAVSEGMGMLPPELEGAGVGAGSLDLEGVADIPGSAIPVLGALQQSIRSWVGATPDVFFVMAVFAITGGALSALRRKEEETVIEKVGIPLGELKERIRKEQQEAEGAPGTAKPGPRQPHPLIAAPVAAHDALNEMVEEVVQRVIETLRTNEMFLDGRSIGGRGAKEAKGAAKARISTGGAGPRFDEMEIVRAGGAADVDGSARTGGSGWGPGRSSARAARHAARKSSQPPEAEDWEVVDTTKGRRPIRVVYSSPPASSEEPQERGEARAAPLPRGAVALPEPPMRVSGGRRGILRRRKGAVDYGPDEGGAGVPGGPSWSGEQSLAPPEGAAGAGAKAPSRKRDFQDLSIIWPMLESEGDGEGTGQGVRVSSSVGSLEEPSVDDTMEASSIAEAAARELAELARVEDGPEFEGEDDPVVTEARPGVEALEVSAELPGEEPAPDAGQGAVEKAVPEAVKKPRTKPKGKGKRGVKSTARKVKHPAGALRSRGSNSSLEEDASYADELVMTGVAEWDASSEGGEAGGEGGGEGEEDLFNPRRVEDETLPDDDDHAAWEEERIAAIVREREDWDSL